MNAFKNANANAKQNLVRYDLYLASLQLDEMTMQILDNFAEYFYLAGKSDKLAEIAEAKRNGEIFI